MSHLRMISAPRKATIIVDDPNNGGLQADAEDVVAILDTVFGFVFELIDVKGKSNNA